MLYLVKSIADELKDHELWLRTDGKAGKRADFSGRTLDGENFSGKDLRRALFINANLIGCRFVGANLTGAIMSRSIISGCNFRNASMQGVNLEKAQIVECDLSGARMHGAFCKKSVVSYTTLWSAVVDEMTSFVDAKLIGLNLNGLVRLGVPDFTAAKLSECVCANAPGSKKKNCRPYVQARYVSALHGGCAVEGLMELIELHEAFLKNGESMDLDLSFTILQDLDLQGRDLRGIRFRNALLKNVNLAQANIDGCDFTGSEWIDVLTVGVTGKAIALKNQP